MALIEQEIPGAMEEKLDTYMLSPHADLRRDYQERRSGLLGRVAEIHFPINDGMDRYNTAVHPHTYRDQTGLHTHFTVITRREPREVMGASNLEAWDIINGQKVKNDTFPTLPYEDPSLVQIDEETSIISGVNAIRLPNNEFRIQTNFHLAYHKKGSIVHVDEQPFAQTSSGLKDTRIGVALDHNFNMIAASLGLRPQGVWPKPDDMNVDDISRARAKDFGRGRITYTKLDDLMHIGDIHTHINANHFPSFEANEWGGLNGIYPLMKKVGGEIVWGQLGHHSNSDDQGMMYDVTSSETNAHGQIIRDWRIELTTDSLPQPIQSLIVPKRWDLRRVAFPTTLLPLPDHRAMVVFGAGDTTSMVADIPYPFSAPILNYHDVRANQELFEALAA